LIPCWRLRARVHATSVDARWAVAEDPLAVNPAQVTATAKIEFLKTDIVSLVEL
jgi:hypothetical protein